MKTRLISSAIGISFVIVVLLLSQFVSPMFTTVLLSLLSAVMVGEALTAKKLMGTYKISMLCIAFGFALPMFSFTKYSFLPFYIFLLLMLGVMVFSYKNIKIGDISFAFFTSVLISIGIAYITRMTTLFEDYTAFYTVIIIGIPWVADAGAYFAGVKLGKHKLCPEISPKKTVEGALGGLVAGLLSAVIFGLVFDFIFRYDYINYVALIIIGLINTPLSMLGDLSFSIIKRNLGIKDYGSVIPGHGGFLDRFDSVIVTAPLVYVVSLFTNAIIA